MSDDRDTTTVDNSHAPDTSLRDAIDAAYTDMENQTSGEGAAPDPGAPSAETKVERPDNAGSPQRARGPDGKFIEKSAAETEKAVKAPIDPKAAAAQQPPTAQPSGVPETLPAEGRAIFQKLPPDAQKFFAAREQQFNQAFSQRGRELSGLQSKLAEFEDVVAPYHQELAVHGMTPGAAIKQLLGLRDFARKDPVAYAKWFIEGHKIDPASLGASQAAEQKHPDIQRLESQLSQIQGHVTQAQQAEETRIVNGIVSAMTAFKQEAGPDGQPAHPYFDQLEPEMTVIAQAIRAKFPNAGHAEVLKVAYDRAVWMNPTTRQATLAAQTQAAEAKRRADATTHAAQARKAAVQVTGAPGGSGGGAKSPDDLRDTISQAYDAQMNGGARA